LKERKAAMRMNLVWCRFLVWRSRRRLVRCTERVETWARCHWRRSRSQSTDTHNIHHDHCFLHSDTTWRPVQL